MYTDTVNPELIPLLKEYGMKHVYTVKDTVDILVADGDFSVKPTIYAEAFDWIAERYKLYINVEPYYDMADETIADDYFDWNICHIGGTIHSGYYGCGSTWKECADAAIRKALTEIIHTFGVACDTCGYIYEFTDSDIHKPDEDDENSYVICPTCGTKLYIAD